MPASSSKPRHRDQQCAAVAAQRDLCRVPLRAPAAQGLSVPRLPAPDQPGPQPFRRLHGGAGRCRRHGDRRHAQLSTALEDVARDRPKPGHRVIGAVAGALRAAHGARRRHRRHEMPTREELADIAEEAAGVARRMGYEPRVALLAFRPSAIRPASARRRCRRRCASSTSAASISSMTARWPPTWRSTARLMQQYPFCRLSGPRPMCSSCRPSTRPRSPPRCCRNSAARR
jgi:hypothetical protein